MSLFGEKAPCPNCGKKVREAKDPSDFLCPHCNHPGPWASPDQRSKWATEEADRQSRAVVKAAAREEYVAVVYGMVGGGDIAALAPKLPAILSAGGLQEGDVIDVRLQAFTALAESTAADDILTPDENQRLDALLSALRMQWEMLPLDLTKKVSIAAINGGILPEVVSPQLMAKKGEIVHIEWPATLMREVAVRQYVGGYQGVSIPIGKTGMRYRVGGSRGHSVQVGTQLQVADSGILAVTNKRAVYMGTSKTVDMPYSKMVNLTVYSDGLQFHLSNRVNAPLFRLQQHVDLVAAIINAAAQGADS